MTQILIINQHTANYGDDAAGVAMAEQLRTQFPDAELHFVYNWPWQGNSLSIPYSDDNTFHHTHLIIAKHHLKDAIKYVASKIFGQSSSLNKSMVGEYVEWVKKSDFVIVSPGGANIGIYQDWICLFRILVAVLENKKPIFHLNTIGKSTNIIFNIITKYVLTKSKIFVREKQSYQELKDWGIFSVQGVDTALSLSKKKTLDKNIYENRSKEYLVFIPTRVGKWHPYFNLINIQQKIKNVIIPSLLIISKKTNLNIIILPHLYGPLQEKKLLHDIYNQFVSLGISEENITLINELNSFYDYDQYISKSSLVVSMRYHGVIFAIKNSIPFISLAYENKMKEACRYSGMSDFNFDLTNTALQEIDLIQAMENLYENKVIVAEQITNKLTILNQLSRLPVMLMYLDYVEIKK